MSLNKQLMLQNIHEKNVECTKKQFKPTRQCQKYRINFKVRQYIVSFVDIRRYFIEPTRLIIIFIENKKVKEHQKLWKKLLQI